MFIHHAAISQYKYGTLARFLLVSMLPAVQVNCGDSSQPGNGRHAALLRKQTQHVRTVPLTRASPVLPQEQDTEAARQQGRDLTLVTKDNPVWQAIRCAAPRYLSGDRHFPMLCRGSCGFCFDVENLTQRRAAKNCAA